MLHVFSPRIQSVSLTSSVGSFWTFRNPELPSVHFHAVFVFQGRGSLGAQRHTWGHRTAPYGSLWDGVSAQDSGGVFPLLPGSRPMVAPAPSLAPGCAVSVKACSVLLGLRGHLAPSSMATTLPLGTITPAVAK